MDSLLTFLIAQICLELMFKSAHLKFVTSGLSKQTTKKKKKKEKACTNACII